MEVYWLIPKENMTERRFSDTLRVLSDLPMTNVPTYEPDYPDAPLLSSVRLPLRGFQIHNICMDFIASTRPSDYEDLFALTEHLEYLVASWRKWDISDEVPYNVMLLKTIGMVAESMGAVYAVYGHENRFIDLESFEQLWDVSQVFHFVSNPLVETAGRDRFFNMGRVLEVSNGLVIKLYDDSYDQMIDLLKEMWLSSEMLHGECLRKEHKRPPYVEDEQVIPELPPFEYVPDPYTLDGIPGVELHLFLADLYIDLGMSDEAILSIGIVERVLKRIPHDVPERTQLEEGFARVRSRYKHLRETSPDY
jgi:hypothetical protein